MGITPKQYEQMQNRLKSSKTRRGPMDNSVQAQSTGAGQIILGIDPSLRNTGYGIIVAGKPHPRALTFGTISSPKTWERSRCLLQIADSLRTVLKEFAPDICIIESLFYAQNLQTALIMGEARGASLVVVAEAGLQIFEIAPRKVKQAIVGYGAAQKLAVAKMVQRMLHLDDMPAPDAADALALALTHAQSVGSYAFTAPKRV